MTTVAITGVSGFIGSRLLQRLEQTDEVERVVGVDLRPPATPTPKLRFYQHNVTAPMASVFATEKVDAAVHLAFVVRPRQDRARAEETNIQGTRNFLDACTQSSVRHITYLSSHTVYGAHPDNPVPLTEDAPLRPHRGFQYSWDKAQSEALFREFAHTHPHVPVAILRTCVVLGATADSPVARSLFQPVMVRVAGHNPALQFIHLDDLVELVAALLARRHGGVLNVAGASSITYRDLATLARRKSLPLPGWLLRSVMGATWALRLQSQSPPDGLRFIMHPIVLSTDKMTKQTGFCPKYSSQQAVMAYLAATRQARSP